MQMTKATRELFTLFSLTLGEILRMLFGLHIMRLNCSLSVCLLRMVPPLCVVLLHNLEGTESIFAQCLGRVKLLNFEQNKCLRFYLVCWTVVIFNSCYCNYCVFKYNLFLRKIYWIVRILIKFCFSVLPLCVALLRNLESTYSNLGMSAERSSDLHSWLVTHRLFCLS